ncbi:MAG: SDR family oxidoreductase [Myxococcales bacterium]|nr:SDR family oxidoreductase [Myxococcales bacterium]
MSFVGGKVVVVSGGGRGVGRAEALALAQGGATVVVHDAGLDLEGREVSEATSAISVVDEIQACGGQAVAHTGDLRDGSVVQELIDLALQRFGRIDGAICSVGIQRDRSLLKMPPEDFRDVVDNQLIAPFRFAQGFARAFVAQGTGGSILLTSSPTAFFGAIRQTNLSAASAGIVGLVRSAATELRKHRVRINALAPTARTRATETLPTFQGIRASSLGPEHAGPIATYLMSDAAEQVSGEILGVAGGRLYALRVSETPGAFSDGEPFTPLGIGERWREITRVAGSVTG